MHIISSFLFSFSANIDNLAVGIAYGIKKLKISILNSIIIAFISCMGTFFSMIFGQFIKGAIPNKIENSIGSLILIGFGLWSLYETLKKEKLISKEDSCDILSYDELLEKPEKADLDNSGYIDLKESLLLGIALAINNMGMGIGASITGLNIAITSCLTFLFSFIFITLGRYAGEKFLSNIIGKLTGILSGLIIILLGLYELFI